MTHCQIILLHHNPDRSFVYSVLDQFEQSIIDQKHNGYINQEYHVLQSKRKLASFISQQSALDGDVSRIIADFAPPPLIITKSHAANLKKPDILFSFYDHFVDFNRYSLLNFASKMVNMVNFTKTCFIQLFDEKEAETLLTSTNDENEMMKVYGFLTRLYSSAFDKAHHIHLFAKHHRAKIDNAHHDGMQFEEETNGENGKQPLLIQMKSMNVYDDMIMNGNNNQLLKNHHLTSHLTSMKILSHLLSSIIVNNKVSPMAMFDINGSLSLISKIRLRLNVAREIRSLIDPLYLQSNECIGNLLDHILRVNQKYQSNAHLRVSYVKCN